MDPGRALVAVMDIRFGDHPSFHRAAAGMVGASAALGLALHPVTAMAPIAGGLVGIAAGAALAHGRAAWRIGAAALACVPLSVVGASASGLAPASVLGLASASGAGTSLAVSVAVAAVLVAFAISFGLRGARGLVALVASAAAVMLAMWAAARFGSAQQLDGWPSWARDGAASAAMGMIGVLALLPRHVRVALDPVRATARRLPSEIDGEVRELCDRSLAIWESAKGKLDDGDPGKQLVREGVLKTLEVAASSAQVQAAGASEQELAKRIADLDARIAAASDGEVKAQYQAARTALDDQRRYREHIKQNRERLIARMHNHVAALEKFQLAASGLLAARAASAGAGAVKQLDELSQDVAASGEALAELELGAATGS